MMMILPKSIVIPESMPLYWDSDHALHLSLTSPQPLSGVTAETIDHLREITALYLQAPSSRQRGPERDFIALFAPDIPLEMLPGWFDRYSGNEQAVNVYCRKDSPLSMGIIRDHSKYSEPRLFKKWITPDETRTEIEIECQALPRRRNLLQPRSLINAAEEGELGSPKVHRIPAAACTIEKLPATKAIFGLFISAILDRVEARYVAQKLNETILKSIGINDLNHVLTAITTPIAQASTDYQKYEFFGDSVLKFTVSCQLFYQNPDWNEGCLSTNRDSFIENNRLAQAALCTGLDRFILTRRFTPRKWNAPLISQHSNALGSTAKRPLSAKVLADVVEALIGAAYKDGGIPKAQACLHHFLPEVDLLSHNDSSVRNSTCGKSVSKPVDHHCLSRLTGYNFNNPAILTEALVHPSCEHDTVTQSYQRIEFLGDAVLDMIVVSTMSAHPTQISEGRMTLIKHAVVNSNLLAFLCMDFAIPNEADKINTALDDNQISLWRFLRFNGPTIKVSMEACLGRHQPLREEIWRALQAAPDYPWELFTRLHADKFFSDIFESVLGAIFIDSGGNIDICQAFVERIGLLPYLRRLIADKVNVIHPRNLAQNMVKGAGSLVFKKKRIAASNGATYTCMSILNGQEIAAVQGCASGEEAELRVAKATIEYLQAQSD
ncbi:Dicer-like protein 2 [Penicillium lagena]|uniref:Dicer-like protein 2 n=1 Tax=Penicillium lagena TaxID=94218 RepID=UPI00253FFE0A|nr:Dicer-like protein 2 [Penicillium lagena]KAJ5605409.1 Dicer-like protein 2 [Penicillium lagena]